MKKFKNLVIGGIETKVFNLILITVILIAVAFQILILYQSRMLSQVSEETGRMQKEAITETTNQVMDAVVNESLDRTTQLEAVIADEFFAGLGTRVELLRDYAQKILEDPDSVPQASYGAPDPALDGQTTTQLILAEDVLAAARGSLSAADENAAAAPGSYMSGIRPELARKIGAVSNMSDMMISIYGVTDATNSCFVAFPEGALLVTDNRSAGKYDADGQQIPFDPRSRPWYKEAAAAKDMIFSDVIYDAFTGEAEIVCAAPVYVDGELAAVVGSDFFLTYLQQQVQASDENGGFLCVINQYGHVIFSPKDSGPFKVAENSDALDLRRSDNRELAQFVTDAMREKTDVRRITLSGSDYYMIGVPMETLGWTFISVFSQEMADKPAQTMRENYEAIQQGAAGTYQDRMAKSKVSMTILLLALTALALAASLMLGKRIVRPLNLITRRIAALTEANLEFKMEDGFRTGDEIEVLAESFARLSHRTVEYIEQVREVTAEKERIGTELQMATQIQEGMLPSIFPPFPDRREFDIFCSMNPAREVGGDFYDFFLLDDDHLAMVIADVSGKGVPAALFMMACKIILSNNAMNGLTPAQVLEATNTAVCANNPQEMFVTVWLGILEISTGRITAANAGHEYPAVKKGGQFALYKDKHGFVIGGLEGIRYKEYEMQLEPGDKIFLYTDGVPEATNMEQTLFGTDRMLEALNLNPEVPPRGILANVQRAVDRFVGSSEQFDDLTMLCLEYHGPRMG